MMIMAIQIIVNHVIFLHRRDSAAPEEDTILEYKKVELYPMTKAIGFSSTTGE